MQVCAHNDNAFQEIQLEIKYQLPITQSHFLDKYDINLLN